MSVRLWYTAVLLFSMIPMGCSRSRSTGTKEVGGDLPVTSSSSVALPGATDAADAPRAPSVAESQRADVTAYHDPITRVSFRYPTVWRPAAGQGLPAPAFAGMAGNARITQAFTSDGSPYAPTVLRALTFSYTVKPGSNEKECAALPVKVSANATTSKTEVYGGVSFTEATGGDAGACTRVQTQVDSALRGKQCLVFERDFITTCPYVKSKTLPRPLTSSETAALQARLDAIMRSVQIAP